MTKPNKTPCSVYAVADIKLDTEWRHKKMGGYCIVIRAPNHQHSFVHLKHYASGRASKILPHYFLEKYEKVEVNNLFQGGFPVNWEGFYIICAPYGTHAPVDVWAHREYPERYASRQDAIRALGSHAPFDRYGVFRITKDYPYQERSILCTKAKSR